MNYCFMLYPGFRRKALTLSYDDGVIFDKRLIEIMDKHGLKGTFNINSGRFAQNEGEWRMTEKTAYELYANSTHEVAVHGVEHLSLGEVPLATGTMDIVNDRLNLEKLFGKQIRGMAYANGSVGDNAEQILTCAGIRYSRTTRATEKFDIPSNWLKLDPTCHHNHPRLMEMAKEFVEFKQRDYTPARRCLLFYLWGHSYEFNNNNNWEVIEEFAEFMGGRDDVWYATNMEIYTYVKAFESLEWFMDMSGVYNPSAIPVCVEYKNIQCVVNPGETVRFE
ncbi:MAG: polysaccharide deacetylase [Clostridiales bacterium]|nr:polysaccharide deacetylase [Clostridiales bacterium]